VPTNFETIVSHNVVADANAADARCVVTGKSVLNGAPCRGTPFDVPTISTKLPAPSLKKKINFLF
jgi:hypothetical protein